MYCNHYGFSEKPFDITPDSRFLFQTSNHRETLASLIYGIQERRGFIYLVGEVGTGKTLLLNAALDRLDDKVKVAFIFNTNLKFEHMLMMALYEWGLVKPNERLSRVDAIQRLNNFAIQQFAKGGNVVLIMDEAQNLKDSVIENLRLLSNLETKQSKLIQIVLSGQPELDAKLSQHKLRQLAQRICLRRHITPLSETETQEYLQHRLKIAGFKGPSLFSRGAKKLIFKYSGGIPRKINILCDNALLIGYGLGKKRIDAGVIKEAIKDLCWNSMPGNIETQTVALLEKPKSQPKRKSSRGLLTPGVALASAASLVFVLAVLLGNSKISLGKNTFFSANTAAYDNSIEHSNSTEPISVDGRRAEYRPYSLRLSCFRSKKNARKALSYYKSRGLSPYIVKVDLENQNVWWTIYSGSFKTHKEAEKIRKKFKVRDAVISNTPYANFLGDFSSEIDIADSIHQLEKLGYFAYTIKTEKGTLRLYAGAFATREAAEKNNAFLQADGIVRSEVVKR